MEDYQGLLRIAIDAAIAGGKKIMEVYDSLNISITLKKDFSPLTEADIKSNEIIKGYLKETGLPFLSEEEKRTPYSERRDWDLFWIVDPLDGTKEFIKRNGEFTVNIALIKGNSPVMGIIYAPYLKDLYFSCPGSGSYKISQASSDSLSNKTLKDLIAIASPLPVSASRDRIAAIGSRSHMSMKTWTYFRKLRKKYKNPEILKIGSALKLCLVAEGKADLYPRFSPSMEWDIAAGHAIIEGAGFLIREYSNNKPLRYNKENLNNPFFIAGKPDLISSGKLSR
jgi:3'(2'), 5'-bisphosphate nucleotidase